MNLFIILLSILYCIVYVECGCFNVQLQLLPIDNGTLITDINKAYIKAVDGTTLVCNETVSWKNGKATCGNSKINITVTPTQWRIYSGQTLTYLTNDTDKRSITNTTLKSIDTKILANSVSSTLTNIISKTTSFTILPTIGVSKNNSLIWTKVHREYHTSWIPFTEYGNNGLIKISQYNCTANVLSKYKNKQNK